jgi:hypothetical protein
MEELRRVETFSFEHGLDVKDFVNRYMSVVRSALDELWLLIEWEERGSRCYAGSIAFPKARSVAWPASTEKPSCDIRNGSLRRAEGRPKAPAIDASGIRENPRVRNRRNIQGCGERAEERSERLRKMFDVLRAGQADVVVIN